MSNPSREEFESYTVQARETVDALTQQLRELAESNQELLAKNETYTATGSATFAAAFIWGNLTLQLRYSTGENVRFYGEHWGVGLGGGISWGGAVLTVSPRELLGEGSYQATVTSAGTAIHLWRGRQYLGFFAGAGLSVGAMAVGGSGKWSAG